MNRDDVLDALSIAPTTSGAYAGGWRDGSGPMLPSIDPTTEAVIATVREADITDYEAAVSAAQEAFAEWRMVPAPVRGQYVRAIGDALRTYKEPLGALVAMEMGKISAEGEGEGGRAQGRIAGAGPLHRPVAHAAVGIDLGAQAREGAVAHERHGSSSDRLFHGPQSGWTLLPAPAASLWMERPSRSEIVIAQVPLRSHENTRWRPFGAHDGYSQEPWARVIWRTCRVARSMTAMSKPPDSSRAV